MKISKRQAEAQLRPLRSSDLYTCLTTAWDALDRDDGPPGLRAAAASLRDALRVNPAGTTAARVLNILMALDFERTPRLALRVLVAGVLDAAGLASETLSRHRAGMEQDIEDCRAVGLFEPQAGGRYPLNDLYGRLRARGWKPEVLGEAGASLFRAMRRF